VIVTGGWKLSTDVACTLGGRTGRGDGRLDSRAERRAVGTVGADAIFGRVGKVLVLLRPDRGRPDRGKRVGHDLYGGGGCGGGDGGGVDGRHLRRGADVERRFVSGGRRDVGVLLETLVRRDLLRDHGGYHVLHFLVGRRRLGGRRRRDVLARDQLRVTVRERLAGQRRVVTVVLLRRELRLRTVLRLLLLLLLGDDGVLLLNGLLLRLLLAVLLRDGVGTLVALLFVTGLFRVDRLYGVAEVFRRVEE